MNNVGSTTLLHPVFINLEQVIIFRRVEHYLNLRGLEVRMWLEKHNKHS